MQETETVIQVLRALDNGIEPELQALKGVVNASDEEILRAIACVAQYDSGLSIEREVANAEQQRLPVTELPAGTVLGEFQVEGVLGRGAMGTVYRARQASLGNRLVALKVLSPELSLRDARFAERFRREAQLAAGIHHPNVAEVYGYGEAHGLLFFAMRLVSGRSLHEVLRDLARDADVQQRMASAERVRACVGLAHGVADALSEVHSRGLVHRDVKPANIILEGAADDPVAALTARPVLVDFGLLRATGESLLTGERELLGTPAYAAPEAQLGRNVTAPADVFSWGATLHDLLTGTPGTRAPATAGLRGIRSVNPAVDERLAAIMAMALQERPALRYEHGGALRDELERYLKGEPIRALPTRAWGRFKLWVMRDTSSALRVIAAMVLSIAVLSVVITVGGWVVRAGNLAADARRLQDEGDLLGAAVVLRDLKQASYVSWMPWLQDDLRRADALQDTNEPLGAALLALSKSANAARSAVGAQVPTQLSAAEEQELVLAHYRLCEVLFGPRQEEFRDAIWKLLLRELGSQQATVQRIAMDTWADYLIVQGHPQQYPAELPARLAAVLNKPHHPNWLAAIAPYAAIRSAEVFRTAVELMEQLKQSPVALGERDTTQLWRVITNGAYHNYRWLHAHLPAEFSQLGNADHELWAAAVEGGGAGHMAGVSRHLAWWESHGGEHVDPSRALTLGPAMRALVDASRPAIHTAHLRHAQGQPENAVAQAACEKAERLYVDKEQYEYFTGIAPSAYAPEIWVDLPEQSGEISLATRKPEQVASATNGRVWFCGEGTVSDQTVEIKGTVTRVAIAAATTEAYNTPVGHFLRLARHGQSRLSVTTRVPPGARGLTVCIDQIVGLRPLLRDGGRVLCRLGVRGSPVTVVSEVGRGGVPVMNRPHGETDLSLEARRESISSLGMMATFAAHELPRSEEITLDLEYLSGNTTYRVVSFNIYWEMP